MKLVLFNKELIKIAQSFVNIREQESVGLRDNHGMKRGSVAQERDRQLRGVLGEWAVSNAVGLSYLFTINTFKAPDLVLQDGRGIQVKCSMRQGPLVVRRDAKDNEVYVLTWMTYLNDGTILVTCVGWLTAYEARLLADIIPELWRDPLERNSPAIFVPTYLLRDMEELVDGRSSVGIYGPTDIRQPNTL